MTTATVLKMMLNVVPEPFVKEILKNKLNLSRLKLLSTAHDMRGGKKMYIVVMN